MCLNWQCTLQFHNKHTWYDADCLCMSIQSGIHGQLALISSCFIITMYTHCQQLHVHAVQWLKINCIITNHELIVIKTHYYMYKIYLYGSHNVWILTKIHSIYSHITLCVTSLSYKAYFKQRLRLGICTVTVTHHSHPYYNKQYK